VNAFTVFIISILMFVIGINLCELIFTLRSSVSIIQVASLVISVGWMGFLFGAESKKEFLFRFGNACFERGVASTSESP